MKFKWIPPLHEFHPIREEVLKRVLEFRSFQIFSKLPTTISHDSIERSHIMVLKACSCVFSYQNISAAAPTGRYNFESHS